ncbi:MAG: DUF4190 domain-containing protein [Phycisphaerales bacterium]
MSQNPFSPQAQMEYQEPQRQRMSVLAVMSLIFSLLSFPLCCASCAVIPPAMKVLGAGALVIGAIPSVLGILMGISALMRIGQSQGRMRGKGLAVTGIVLGLISVLFWVGMVIGGNSFAGTTGATASSVMRAADAKDAKEVRSAFSPTYQQVLTDAQIAEFSAHVQQKSGKFIGSPANIGEYISWLMGPTGQATEQMGQGTGSGRIPVPLKYEKDFVLLVLVADPATPPQGLEFKGAIKELVVYFNDGTSITLPPGGVSPAPVPIPPPTPNSSGSP